jgi:glycerol-1-phosphate dehydrogenase [NAD(P)+]
MSRLEAALQAARDTKQMELGHGVLARTAEVFRRQFGDAPGVIVGDPHTMDAAGYSLMGALAHAGMRGIETIELRDPNLYAEHRFVEEVQSELGRRTGAVPIAVGSGTINDLVKLASHRLGRPYMCVATAASMDGYTAYGASITFEGSKQTFECPAPRAVVADIDVISKAPAHMTASGYADLLAKLTAGADWILADALGIEPIDRHAWETVQGGLSEALRDPAGCARGDFDAIEKLTEGLMMGGFAMQSALSSRPASGAEHQFSHLWDMQHHTHNGAAPSHGFKVGVATVAIARFYEALLDQNLQELDVDRAVSDWPERAALEQEIKQLIHEPEIVQVAIRESLAKYVDREALRQQLTRLRQIWPGLKERIRKQLPGWRSLSSMLSQAGAPTEPEQIGISRQRLRMSFNQARHIRRRFTVLDLAARAGVTDLCLAGMGLSIECRGLSTEA